ncbi:MAG: dihydroorotate dehydrogenase [Clostridiales bacterium]|nr:dihydroorotate dehydrogenase [Clostridiales bacterium]
MNLKVDICGKTLKNPVIAASGCFGFGREMSIQYDLNTLGGIALKAVTAQKRIGNPPPRIAETPSGMLNAVGLQNSGVDQFIVKEMPFLDKLDTILFANVAGSTIEEYIEVTEKLQNIAVDFIELNISCPNVKEGGNAFGAEPDTIYKVVKQVKKVSKQPLIVKLSPNTVDIAANAVAAQEAGADGISLINTLIGMSVDVDRKRPILANISGGLSGPAIKPVALSMVYKVAQAVSIPIIGMGGIMTGRDAVEFLLCGATAVMCGTLNLIEPDGIPNVIAGIEEYMTQHKIDDINELIGGLIV